MLDWKVLLITRCGVSAVAELVWCVVLASRKSKVQIPSVSLFSRSVFFKNAIL